MRVLQVIGRLNVGGAAIHAITLTRSLEDRGYATTLVRGVEDPKEGNMDHLAAELDVRPVLVSSLKRRIGWHDVRALLVLVRLIRREAPQLLHTHAAKAGALGRGAAMLAPRRRRPRIVVHTFHGHVLSDYFSGWQTAVFKRLERWLARRTTLLVAVAQEVKEDLIRLGIAPEERIAVVPCGFDLDRFELGSKRAHEARVATRSRLGVGTDERLVTIVARTVPIKRIDRFLRVAQRLGNRREVRFLIVGDGELSEQLRASSISRALGERIIWAGLQRDLPAFYAASDVVVLTSDNEGTPVSLIEAQAAGVPVVSTNVGGVSSVVAHNETGLLVDRDDEDGFADAVGAVLDDPVLTERLIARARAHALTHFTLDRQVDDLDHLYRRLLADATQ